MFTFDIGMKTYRDGYPIYSQGNKVLFVGYREVPSNAMA